MLRKVNDVNEQIISFILFDTYTSDYVILLDDENGLLMISCISFAEKSCCFEVMRCIDNAFIHSASDIGSNSFPQTGHVRATRVIPPLRALPEDPLETRLILKGFTLLILKLV